MPQSKITSKYQVTIPKAIRERLGLRPRDRLIWEIVDGEARVRPARDSWKDLRGCVAVGPGSTVQDVRRARAARGQR